MSGHFKLSLASIAVIAALLAGVFLWLKHKAENIINIPSVIPHKTRLLPDDRELIEFNEKTHRVSMSTSSGTVTMYARNPAVHLKKDGRVVIDRHLFGFQSRYSAGVGYSDTLRGIVGYNPLYWGAFEASASAGMTLDKKYTFVKPYLGVGYNFWGNLLVNGQVNPISFFTKSKDDVPYMLSLTVKI